MSLSQTIDVARSTRGLSGTTTPSLYDRFPPSPGGGEKYEKLALPQLPSPSVDLPAWGKKLLDDFATLKPILSLDPKPELGPKPNSDEGSITVVYRGDIADKSSARPKKEKLWLNTMTAPRTKRDTLVSPQPQPQSSLTKIEKLSGLSISSIPPFRETTPTGHDSGKKIQRLTGLELGRETPDGCGEVSPLSINGIDYGAGGLATAVSDLDDHADLALVPSALPSPLCVIKPTRSSRQREPRDGRYSAPLLLSPRLEGGGTRPKSPRATRNDQPIPDLYHATARLIAKDDSRTAQKTRPAVRKAAPAEPPSIADSDGASKGKQLPPMPNRGRRRRQPKDTPGAQPGNSAERPPATQEPSKVLQNPSYTGSTSISEQCPRSFHTQDSAIPDRPRTPVPQSAFDFDSDSSPPTVGTPETGGSIPISLAGDANAADAKASAAATAAKGWPHRRRSSIMAKVFRGRAASNPNTPTPTPNTAMPPVPPLPTAPRSTPLPALSPQPSPPSSAPRTTPPRPVRTFPPLYAAFPRLATTTTASTTTLNLPARRQTDPAPAKNGPRAKRSVSALFGAAVGLIGAGMGIAGGERTGEEGEEESERRRERLKRSIRHPVIVGGELGGGGLLSFGEGARVGGRQQQQQQQQQRVVVEVGEGVGLGFMV